MPGGLIPDGIIMGKSIGGSLTLGAFMGRSEIMDCLPAPAHLFTLGANALACAAGNAAFGVYQTPAFQALLRANIEAANRCCAQLKEKHPELVALHIGKGDRSKRLFFTKADAQAIMDLARKQSHKILVAEADESKMNGSAKSKKKKKA